MRHGDFLSLSCGSSSSSTLNHSKPDDNAGVQVVGRGGYYDETYPGDALPKENYRKDFGTAIMLASDKVQTRGTSEVPVSITFADLNTSNFVAPTPSANGAKSAYGALNPKS